MQINWYQLLKILQHFVNNLIKKIGYIQRQLISIVNRVRDIQTTLNNERRQQIQSQKSIQNGHSTENSSKKIVSFEMTINSYY